ncbi:hypothetical protein AB4851_15490 [Burkholderia sp. 22PA0099]|uniref:hypothetical protein n=1 Tax=unclassified Burkholderia TaxID=2613784 RepID=UPI0039C35CDE
MEVSSFDPKNAIAGSPLHPRCIHHWSVAGRICHARGCKHARWTLLTAAPQYLRASVGDQIKLWDLFEVVGTLPMSDARDSLYAFVKSLDG